jgi:vacuolar protein sorting-associated protein 54
VKQAKSFLQNFHQGRISRSAKLVEDEQWTPAEVSPELQSAVGLFIDSAIRDPPELIIPALAEPGGETPNGSTSDSQNLAPPPTTPTPVSLSASSSDPSPPNQAPNGLSTSKHIRIEERTFFTVSATSAVLHLLLDYLKVIVNLTMLTPDTMSKVIEFLKAFNSRTCQVVLGAGAMRSAGLKNITARHLGEFPYFFAPHSFFGVGRLSFYMV